MPPTLTHEEARSYYDKFGAKQDQQGFYEDAAIDLLVEFGGFPKAEKVLEFGTGRLAARLLADHLPATAHYVAVDISSTMVELAKDRLAPFGERQEVHLSHGEFDFSRYGYQ